MSLIDRLASGAENNIPVHTFWAALAEHASLLIGTSSQQELNRDGVINYFNLTGDEITEFDWLVGRFMAATNKAEFVRTMHILFILKEQEVPGYTDKADLTVRINRIP